MDSDEDDGCENGSDEDYETTTDAIITEFDDNDSDVVILEERQVDHGQLIDLVDSTEDLISQGVITNNRHQSFSGGSSTSYSDHTYFNNNSINENIYSQNFMNIQPLRPSSKKVRTRSLPQLPHARIIYEPPISSRLISTKVGEVKTALVPYNELNYTFTTSVSDSFAGRRTSFSNSTTTKKTNGSACDDKDGHYIVVPGESFANGRFRINKLLGQGTFGKVISAFDSKTNDTVAVKVIRAVPKYREASKIELRVLSMLKQHDPDNKNHCIHLRECFDFRSHICIVTDLLKISLFDFLEKNNFIPFPGSQIQAIAKQLLRSVAFLHDLKLIHTDLKPENILLHDDSYIKRPYHGKKQHTKILNDPLIQIIDFGSLIFDDEYHSQVVSTRHYRAPEIVLNIGWSFECDMWSIGCILVELATGEALFRTHENLEHLAMMEKIIGRPLDLSLVKQCFNRNKGAESAENDPTTDIKACFNHKTGKLNFPHDSSTEKSINFVETLQSLDQLISSKVGLKLNTELSLEENYNLNLSMKTSSKSFKKFDKDECKFWYYFIDLVKRCLIFHPKKRIRAIDALNHHWFDLGIYDDGTLTNTNFGFAH